MKNNDSNKISPPYIPWETFKNFLRTLNKSAVPNRIDSSMMPAAMSGFSKAGVTTALKFFSLIDSDGQTSSNLKELVDACETSDWPTAVKKILVPAYDNIIGDLKLNAATRNELEEKFGDATQQMKDRFIRFYISILQDSGETISPFLTQRQNRPRKSGPKKTIKRRGRETAQDDDRGGGTKQPPTSRTPEDMYDQLIPILGMNDRCFIRVPRDINPSQVELVKAAVAFIEVMAQQNEKSKK